MVVWLLTNLLFLQDGGLCSDFIPCDFMLDGRIIGSSTESTCDFKLPTKAGLYSVQVTEAEPKAFGLQPLMMNVVVEAGPSTLCFFECFAVVH
jgi:hypothetical protein